MLGADCIIIQISTKASTKDYFEKLRKSAIFFASLISNSIPPPPPPPQLNQVSYSQLFDYQ